MAESLKLLQQVEVIKYQLKSSDPLTRLNMVGAIGEACNKYTPQPITSSDEFGHIILKRTVKPALLKNLVEPVVDLLADQEPLIQAEAIWTLGKIGGEKAREMLQITLSDENPHLRAGAVEALGKIGGSQAINLVIESLQDKDDNVRLAAIDALDLTLKKARQPFKETVDTFGHVTLITLSIREIRRILNSLLTVAKADKFEHVRLKAAMKIAESRDSEAIMMLKEMIKRGEPLAVDLGNMPLGESLLHADESEEFQKLSKLLGGIISSEELQELIDVGVIVQSGEGRIAKIHSIVSEIVRATNKRFIESVNLKPTNKKVLCAFTSNVDRVCFLKNDQSAQRKVDRAVEDAVVEGLGLGKTRRNVIREIKHIINEKDLKKLPSKVRTKAQVLGFILRMFRNSGGKRAIDDLSGIPGSGKKLADWIRDVFQPELSKVGGASAQMADFLTGIGEKNVTVYTQYHSAVQADSYQQPTNFIRLIGDQPKKYTVTDSRSTGNCDPTKINYPMERFPSIAIKFNNNTIKAGATADREIFTTEYYDASGKAIDFIPLFQFTPTVLERIGKMFEYFIINGPHYLQRYPQEKYNTVAAQMEKQLKTLKETGIKIHYEFSGNTTLRKGEGKWTGVSYLGDILKGNIHSMGINHKELREVVTSMKVELDPTIEIAEGDDPYSIYRNAIVLATYLGIDRLYVHGHSTDITIRRNATPDSLETETRADFHAKQRVVEWLRGENSRYPTPSKKLPTRLLKREGFTELMQFAETLADNSGLSGIKKVRLMRDIAVSGCEPPKENGYSAVIVPVKWIYGEVKVTTSSGDITSSTALIQSGL